MKSKSIGMKTGVPQGTILEPLLFIIHLFDLFRQQTKILI